MGTVDAVPLNIIQICLSLTNCIFLLVWIFKLGSPGKQLPNFSLRRGGCCLKSRDSSFLVKYYYNLSIPGCHLSLKSVASSISRSPHPQKKPGYLIEQCKREYNQIQPHKFKNYSPRNLDEQTNEILNQTISKLYKESKK